MPRALVIGPIHDRGLALFRARPDVELETADTGDPAVYGPRLAEADAVLIRTQPLDRALVASAPRLAIVSRHGVGYDSIDVDALSARGIPLAVVGDVNSRAVAEHTMMMMLALAHRLTAYDTRTRAGDWGYRNSLDAVELLGRHLLIVGFGRIGTHVAALASAFGMEVSAYDPHLGDSAFADRGIRRVTDLDAGLAAADVVSLHLPRAGDGALIGADRLALMKPDAILVNTARGGLVDEAAIAAALTAGHLAGVGLDVFDSEPPPEDHPLFGLDRLLLSPHSASLTRECAERMAIEAARNILDYFDGRLNSARIVNSGALRTRIPAVEAVRQ